MRPPADKGFARAPSSGDLQLALRRDIDAPQLARAAVTSLCDEHELGGAQRHTMILLVSELVSNAVLHSRAPASAPILLAATLGADRVRVTVTDAGHGFTPTPRDSPGVGGKYGLYLLDQTASQWGVDRRGGTRVWFELLLSPGP